MVMAAGDNSRSNLTPLQTPPLPHFQNSFSPANYPGGGLSTLWINVLSSPSLASSSSSSSAYPSSSLLTMTETTTSSTQADFDADSDEDAELYQKLYGVSLESFKNNSVLQGIYADIQASRPPAAHECVFLMIAVIGFLLNCALLTAQIRLNRKSWRMRNQRVLIAILSSAHALFCFVHIAEFAILIGGAGGDWTGCLQLLKKRTAKSFCNLLVIGSISGCAVDNYLAVCRPMLHRFQSTRLVFIFVSVIAGYVVCAAFLSFSDFVVPFTTDSNCTRTVEMSTGSQRQKHPGFAGLFSFFELSSASDFKSYCQFIDDCRKHTPLIELAITVVWTLAACVVSFSYISVVVVLRSSLSSVFELPPELPAISSSRRFSLFMPTIGGSGFQKERRSEGTLVSQNSTTGSIKFLLSVKRASNMKSSASCTSGDRLSQIEDNEDNFDEEGDSPPSLPSNPRRFSSTRKRTSSSPTSIAHLKQADSSASNGSSFRKISIKSSSNVEQLNGTAKKTSNEPPVRIATQLSVRFSVEPEQLSGQQQQSQTESNSPESSPPGRQAAMSRRRSSVSQIQQLTLLRNRRRSSYALLIILAVFIVTWLPFVSFQIANEFFFTEHFRINVMRQFLPIFAYLDPLQLLSSVIDPIVYSLTYGEMRRWLSHRLCSKHLRNSSSGLGSIS